eukprot:4553844-Pyramimonas_sp.AAC.1
MDSSPEDIRTVARGMTAWTARGVDRLGPRGFLLLSDECLLALNALWSWMLRDGLMPSQISCLAASVAEARGRWSQANCASQYDCSAVEQMR